MLLDLVNLLIGFQFILVSMAILLHYYRVRRINFFFFVLLFIAGIGRFQYGLSAFGFIAPGNLNVRFFMMMFLMPPIYLLCIKTFFSINITTREIVGHFSTFFCIILFRLYFGPFEIHFLRIIFLIYYFIYYIFFFRQSYLFLKSHKTIYSKQQLFKVKQLIIWIISLSLNNFIYTTYFLFQESISLEYIIQQMFHGSVILWVLFAVYLFFNPSILFNEVFKKKDPTRDFTHEFNIWSTRPLQKIEARDVALEQLIKLNSTHLLTDLRTLKAESIISTNNSNLISELSLKLDYPKSHLKFAFKYYCNYSQSDFLNLIRLIYALQLINEGYLENFTFESLAERCDFNSRTSFYRHFKKHLGVSPSQYKTLIE